MQMNWWIESVGVRTVRAEYHPFVYGPYLALIAPSVCPLTFPLLSNLPFTRRLCVNPLQTKDAIAKKRDGRSNAKKAT